MSMGLMILNREFQIFNYLPFFLCACVDGKGSENGDKIVYDIFSLYDTVRVWYYYY